ncbi:hypothetical protein OROGR_015615 [Orobanche gracilis]
MKMGSFEDDDNRNDNNSKIDSRAFETQQIDSQYPAGDVDGDRNDDFQYFTDTVPVDDTYLLDDAFETQYVDLAGETQIVDFVDDTQVLDDLDCMKNMPTEFLNDLYTESVAVNKFEGENKTQVLCETQVLSQDYESVKNDDRDSVGVENTVDDCPLSQGPLSGGFTSIRTASIRASGLAARERGASLNSGPTISDKSSVEQQTCTEHDRECLQNEHVKHTEELRSSSKCQTSSATVRKLFKDDEVGQSETETSDTDDSHHRASENCLAGLSYVNSQEPGELSQAHALEVVDKFLDLNVMDFVEGLGTIVKNAEKSKVAVSGAKGSRDMAKKSSVFKTKDGECGVYDWDDNREDDCGGDFFLKKKGLFFNNGGPKRRCVTEPRNPNGDRKDQKCTKNKSNNLAYSESGSMFRKLRAKGKRSLNCGEKLFQKNLIKDLDGQLNEPNLVGQEKKKDVVETNDVGPDTQLAAEAMETLCFEVHLADDNGNDPEKAKATTKKESSNKSSRSKECSTGKSPNYSSLGVVTRQAKQTKIAQTSARNESTLSPKKSDLTVSENRGKKKHHLQDHLDFSVPVAHRTRKCTELNRSKAADKSFDNNEAANHVQSARVRKRTATKDTVVGSNGSSGVNMNAVDNKFLEKRSRQENLAGHQADSQYDNGRLKRSRKVAVDSSLRTRSGKILLHRNVVNENSSHDAVKNSTSDCEKVGTSSSGRHDEKSVSEKLSDLAKADNRIEASPPAVCRTPINNASPICMGDEYHKQSCRTKLSRLSLITEINNAVTGSPGLYGGTKESRKRKDITDIRVLFSQHLDEDVVKQQKKILTRLGGAAATFMSDATHFVADEFIRTRNMLEAIASGKPVVTHLWLEICGQASCLIDEKNYILKDSRKEREYGFSLPDSLSRACQYPLLQGQKVLVTPNTKPGKDILSSLVKAVHGLAIERVGRSVLKDEKLPDDLLILSCEEDYDICVPFLEKGGAIYSSELLLNGIVKQKLEFERHRLFYDHVKRTRSTLWMKKKNGYLPVTKCK